MPEILDHSTFEEQQSPPYVHQAMLRAGLGLWRLSLGDDGRAILAVNDVFLDILGVNRPDFPKLFEDYLAKFVHPDDIAKTANAISGITTQRPTFEIKHRLYHQPSDTWPWFSVSGEGREFDSQGRCLVIYGHILNISNCIEKKVLEEIQAQASAMMGAQRQALEKRQQEHNQLLDNIQRQVEHLMNVPGSRRDLIQKSLRDEMVKLKGELTAGQNWPEGAFSRYLNAAFKFITNERVWYKAILDSLPFPTSVFDLNRHWTYLNTPAASSMNGKVPDFIGLHYREGWKNFRDSDVVFQEERAGNKNFIRYLPETDRFFDCQSSILLDETSRAIGFIETMQDITDAREAEERMRLMLEASPLASIFFDQNGSILDCNRVAIELCGLANKAEFLEHFYDLLPPAQPNGRPSQKALLDCIAQAFEDGEAQMEIIIGTLDNTSIPGEIQMTRVEWRDGFIVLGYYRDLRSLMAAQSELNRERLLLRDIFDGCPVPFTISVDGAIKFATPFTKKIFGFDVGDNLRQYAVDQDELASIRQDVASGREVNWRPLRIKKIDGSLTENLVNAYMTNYEGQPATMSWLMDVTTLREKERELEVARDLAEASTKAKSEFLANISHEIRTPMNAIIGLTHLLSQTEMTGQQMEYLSKSDSAAKSLLHLINDVLDFSKIEAGKFDITVKEFFLSDVLNRAINMVAGQASDSGLEFMVKVDPNAPDGLTGDDQRLLQILGNLVSNAVKFTPKGEISLEVNVEALTDDEAVLTFLVRDSGIGMGQDQIDKLFTAFDQGDNSSTRRYGGTGLGLALSRRLVELMGGRIWCESAPGQGSLFGFNARFARHDKELRYIEHRSDFTGLTALVVDDNQLALSILHSYLETMGFEVVTASSGQAALAEAQMFNEKNKQLDLLVVDWKMPEMDGLETVKRINELTAPIHVPTALMSTAYYGADIVNKAAEANIKAVLSKPLSPTALYNVLDSILHNQVEPKNKKPLKADSSAELVAHLAGAKILLVEDNEVNQLVAGRILKKAGFQVTVAANGRQAVDKVTSEDFDLVLMDIQMPVMDGLSATLEIRQNPALKELPIVAMTAHALTQDRQKSLEAGMNDHICKPLDVTELFRCLSRWIKTPLKSSEKG